MRGKGILLGGRAAPLGVMGTGLVTAAGAGVAAFERAWRDRQSFLGPAELSGGAGAAGGRVGAGVLRGWKALESEDDLAVPLAGLAMEEAVDGAALTGGRLGLAIGTALGPIAGLERAVVEERRDGAAVPVDTHEFSFESFTSRLARAIGSRSPFLQVERPACFSVTCVSGLCALEQAAADLAFGRADTVLVGGTDTLTRFMRSGFNALGALSPSGRLLPFDVEHDGILIGEAAAFLVLAPSGEELEQRVRACVVSQRLVSDAMHLTSPDPEGKGMARAIAGALGDAGIEPREIGCVTVTACGSAVYDRMQSRAIHAAFGPGAAEEIPVTTWEPSVGHVLAATGALGVVSAVMTIAACRILPAFNVSRVDPECRLRYVLDGSLPLRSPCVLALTVGFGGQNGATVVTSLEMANELLERTKRTAS